MSQSATPVYRFAGAAPLPLEVSFDGGRLTTDGGLPWLEQADAALGLCAAFAAVIPDWRRGPVRHALETLVRQRVFQIACGYEDQDDADTLRTDPLLKLVCGRLPESGRDLASQPTFSRWRTRSIAAPATGWPWPWASSTCASGSGTGCRRTSCSTWTAPTTRPTAQQEGSAYHGYYRQHMYHPLLVFDGETGQLITAVLRPGNAHGSTGRHGGPQAPRAAPARALAGGDASSCAWTAAGAMPAIYAWCEAEGIAYTIGLITNPRLTRAGRAARRPRRSGSGPRAGRRRSGCSARRPTRPSPGTTRGASSSRPKPCPRARTPASSSPPAPIRRRRSTTGTSPAARARTGSRI